MSVLTNSSRVTPPGVRTVALAGLAAIAGSLLAAFALAELGRAIFTFPVSFDKFNVGGYGVLTVGGVIGATVAWGVVARLAPAPRQLLARLAVVVTVVLLLPDVWLFTQAGNPTGPVIILMIMHIAIAVISYFALVSLAPAKR